MILRTRRFHFGLSSRWQTAWRRTPKWEDSENARLGFRLPSPISQTRPEYTEQARAAKLEGSVQVYVEVQADGTTSSEHMMVAHGLGMGLDKKAIEAVSKWKFKPAQ